MCARAAVPAAPLARLPPPPPPLQHPGSWAEGLVEEKVIKKFIAVNMEQEADAVFEDAIEAIRGLKDDAVVGPPAGICTFCELSVPMVARLAEELGLPGPSANAIDMARNKYKTRACMTKAGLPTPSNYLVKSEEDLDEAIRTVGFPSVLKPINGAASLGVKKVLSAEELVGAFREVKAEMESTVVTSGALVKCKTVDSELDAAAASPASEELFPPVPAPKVEIQFMCDCAGKWRPAREGSHRDRARWQARGVPRRPRGGR